MRKNELPKMNNVGIVVENLDNAISFFKEMGLKLEGRAMIEGEWSGRVTGPKIQSVEIAMMITPYGHAGLNFQNSSHRQSFQTTGQHPLILWDT